MKHAAITSTKTNNTGSHPKNIGPGENYAAGFQAWRERQQMMKSEDTLGDDSSEYADTESTDIPMFSDVESYRSEVASRLEPSQIDVQSGTLSPDQFDALADQIITRVKKELKVPVNKSSVRSEIGYGYPNSTTVTQHNISSQMEANSHQGNAGLDSHYCSKCSKLMVSDLVVTKYKFTHFMPIHAYTYFYARNCFSYLPPISLC